MQHVQKYIKKAIPVEAIQWNGENISQILKFTKGNAVIHNFNPDNIPLLIIHTLEGNMEASIGDYIIKGVDGEFYPCKEDIFLKTYEEIYDF